MNAKRNIKKGKNLKEVDCSRCEHLTKHEVVAKYEAEIEDWYPVYYDHYLVVKCRGCGWISFLREFLHEENVSIDDSTGDSDAYPTVLIYPKRNKEIKPMEDRYRLPPNLATIYEETIEGLNNDLLVLSAIGIRTILEAVCIDNKAPGRNLNECIDGLVDMGLITKTGAAILHNLRFMGNQAAHEVKVHKVKELAAALKVIDHLLMGVYVIPKLSEVLPRKKGG
jgi:hypothetical protein